jgi:DNA-binding NarL/FixJ family response regulator
MNKHVESKVLGNLMTETHDKTALIADDDAYFRMALKSILVKIGFNNVIETESLDSAIDKLTEIDGKVSIALFDLGMPGISSPSSLRAVKEVYPELKIAVVSGSNKKADILSALETGVNGYVPKGLGPSKLATALEQILNGSVFVPLSMTETTINVDGNSTSGISDKEQKLVLERLTPRQKDVLEALVQGKPTKQIANDLGLSETLNVKNRSAAAVAGTKILISDN